MKRHKRTATLDSLIINKLKNMLMTSLNPNPGVDRHTETTDANFSRHAIY